MVRSPMQQAGRRWWRFDWRFGFLLNSPALVIVLALSAFPVLAALWDSFHYRDLMQPAIDGFAGFDNYRSVLGRPEFRRAVVVTLVFVCSSVSLVLVLGLAVALLANSRVMGRTALRTLILLPWAIPPVVNALTWQWIYNSRSGVLNATLHSMGLIDQYKAWLTDPVLALSLTVVAHVWNQLPIATLLLLAGLQVIPTDLTDAATVDRANVLQRFRYVTLPWLIQPIVIVLILETIAAFKVFDLIFVLTGGGPGGSTTVLAWLTYETAFRFLNFGEASAYSFIISLLTLIFAFVYLRTLYSRGEIRT